MSFLLGLKAKLFGLGAILLTVLAFFLRLKTVTYQRDKAVYKTKVLKQEIKVRKQTVDLDKTVEDQLESHRAELIKDLEDETTPANISKPNDNW